MYSLWFLIFSKQIITKIYQTETNYFRIIYEEELEAYVKDLIDSVDNIAEQQMNMLRVNVNNKIDILLRDTKMANGFVYPLSDTIHLFPCQSIDISNYRNWII